MFANNKPVKGDLHILVMREGRLYLNGVPVNLALDTPITESIMLRSAQKERR
jgi:hypothetical protein